MQKNQIKTALVTGASTGIGYDSVRALCEAGFRVVATIRKESDQQKLEKNFGTQVHAIRLDVTDFSVVESLPQMLKEKFQIEHLDLLVNNAGQALAAPFADEDFKEIQNMFAVNVMALMKLTQVLLPLLKQNQNQKAGRIVNISSVAGVSALPFLTVYAATKHAVEGFSEGLRRELMLWGIKVIVIGPGSIQTPIWDKGFIEIKDRYKQSEFSDAFDRFMKLTNKEIKGALPVSAVSSLVVKAATETDPAYRYAPIPNKMRNWLLPQLMPKKIFDQMLGKVLHLI